MAHGAGGGASRRLIEEICLPRLGNDLLSPLADAALFTIDGIGLAITTDAFVVRPLRFPGGSIGALAVHGTVNDLAVSGACPVVLSAAFVVEDGLPIATLADELDAMAAAARTSRVRIGACDTKVVERGAADGLYVITTGVGRQVAVPALDATRIRPGDNIVISGSVADHGIAVLLAREELHINAAVRSDSASVWPLAQALLASLGTDLRCMRDPTRGGVATTLNEFALSAGLRIEVSEAAVPVHDSTRGACELLGLDPLYVANEGCLVAVVAPESTAAALDVLRSMARAPGTAGGSEAALIGEVTSGADGRVIGLTTFGGRRIIDLLEGDPLPRIC